MDSTDTDITELLNAWAAGDDGALERLIPLVEQELRRIAARYFRREDLGHTLQPTALVSELYLRLAAQNNAKLRNREHFFAFSAELIHRVLVDHARRRRADKRGSGEPRIPLDDLGFLPQEKDPEILALDDALRDLAQASPLQSRIVKLRYFGGLTQDEIARAEGVSRRTIGREWNHARRWLRRALTRSAGALRDPE